MKFGGTIKLFKRTSTLFKSGGAVDKTFDKVKKNIKPQNVNYAKKQFDILTRGVFHIGLVVVLPPNGDNPTPPPFWPALTTTTPPVAVPLFTAVLVALAAAFKVL